MRITVAAVIVCWSAIGISTASDVEAAIKTTTNIPAQGLGPALQALAKERGFELLYLSDVVDSLNTRGATGDLTTAEALQKLLSGTGLTYRYLDENTVTVLPLSTTSSAGPPSSAFDSATHALSTPRSSSDPEPPDPGTAKKAGFWQRFRLAQSDQSSKTSDAAEDSESSRQDLPAPQETGKAIPEVIVTAQKREERLIDVPQSVSVLSANDLAKLGASQFRDFADTIPGLSFVTSGAGHTQVTLRGVTAGLDVSPTVGIYVDEVPYGSSTGFARGGNLALDVGVFDLDRVEVLRGPQGTLYGAAAMGGLLKYVTRRPNTKSFGADVQVGAAGTQEGGTNYDIAAAINAPIVTDKVAMRASGYETHDDGYIDNLALGLEDVNRADIYGGRLDFLFTPTEALSVRLTGFAQNISQEGSALADFTPAGTPVDGSLDQRHRVEEPFDQRFRLVSGTVTYDLGPASLTSASSYQTTEAEFIFDRSIAFVPLCPGFAGGVTCSSVGVLDNTSTDKFTQEIRLASAGAHVLEWQLGGFYTHEASTAAQVSELYDLAGQPLPNTLFTFYSPSQYDEYAAFGDLTWNLTDKFDITGGLRYGKNHQRVEQIATGLIGSRPLTYSSEDVFTYLANARYHFNDRATGYLRYATGYRPGGPNFVVTDPNTGQSIGNATYEADELKSYEAGFRAETADRRFGIDLAGYYIDWSNIIVTVVRGGFSGRDNAPGGATVVGQELTLTGRPIRALQLAVTAAHQDAKLSEANTDLRAAKDEQLPNVPRYTATLNADYELPFESIKPTIGATLRFVDERKATFGATAYRLPSYTAVDVRAGFALGSVDAQLYVRNLLDERGQLGQPLTSPAGLAVVSILQPRTIGVSVSKSF